MLLLKNLYFLLILFTSKMLGLATNTFYKNVFSLDKSIASASILLVPLLKNLYFLFILFTSKMLALATNTFYKNVFSLDKSIASASILLVPLLKNLYFLFILFTSKMLALATNKVYKKLFTILSNRVFNFFDSIFRIGMCTLKFWSSVRSCGSF